ncbi:MAG: hypothetical protein A2V77_11065 [Anaeromyxobacter sp. RBG_16_69_14]|nr:MAG: hypothetical protein A2V77_11065 [Anaeromyxobacter sp. RBG_16_69_14]
MASTRNNQRLEDLARLCDPVVRGRMNYYGRFYRSKCVRVLRYLDVALAAWVRWKYKLRNRERASMHWPWRVARRDIPWDATRRTYAWEPGPARLVTRMGGDRRGGPLKGMRSQTAAA